MAVSLYSSKAATAPVDPLLSAMETLFHTTPSHGFDDLFNYVSLKHGYQQLVSGTVNEPLLVQLAGLPVSEFSPQSLLQYCLLVRHTGQDISPLLAQLDFSGLTSQGLVESAVLCTHPEQLSTLSALVLERLPFMEANQIVNLLSQLSQKASLTPALLSAMERHLAQHRHSLSPSDVVNSALALLASGSTNSFLLLENLALAHLKAFSPS